MHVGIFTYQTGHLKTYQMVQKFLAKSYKVTLYAFPFKLRPHEARPFEERPYQIIPLDIKAFCKAAGVDYIEMNGWDKESAAVLAHKYNKPDYLITVIAKIIPQHFIKDHIIINAHPGLLPENRGIDAFKWSIVNKQPIGISLHVINKHIDAGRILKTLTVPITAYDNYQDVCQRAYDMECDLLANFAQYLEHNHQRNEVDTSIPLSKSLVPREINEKFDDIFSSYIQSVVKLQFNC
ncbi:formyl transferase [Pseudoalteromonas sp. SG43-7]|uniref:formyltransferase family protein n=1 Tax=Pseudoalteromonas sp. SG43-7 TaxID=2760966 RepID=UPI00160306AB|nr:formyltransferase family protein [Pseudoalteromonas sp. SG43-7]MBB1421382.1 formyl transferase [Pseudoalteromonas sp. SG43-7]